MLAAFLFERGLLIVPTPGAFHHPDCLLSPELSVNAGADQSGYGVMPLPDS